VTQMQDPFVEYYAKESLSEETLVRFSSTRDAVLRVVKRAGGDSTALTVADVGCGAGAQCQIWARAGHKVRGIDINEKLVSIARQRANQEGLDIQFEVGSAVKLPWTNDAVDVCLLPEVLEHVQDWQPCLSEAVRILRPGGVLYVSTTNRLCPRQQEFSLPLYSWYPAPLKRHYERLSVTTRPEIVNHAKYPAVNWFDFYSLSRRLDEMNVECLDRFDVAALAEHGALSRAVLTLLTSVPPVRLMGHFATSYTVVFGIKRHARAVT
jgi:ubiquinone/menaquinone biosynthesis C-methylase UbiE